MITKEMIAEWNQLPVTIIFKNKVKEILDDNIEYTMHGGCAQDIKYYVEAFVKHKILTEILEDNIFEEDNSSEDS